MLKNGKLFLVLAGLIALISKASCADFFESLLIRLECYGNIQPGCSKNFIDEYPSLRWSHDNLTEATTHFYMFSKENPDHPELMHKCGGGLPENTTFNPNYSTEIVIPGFVSGICNMAIFREIKNERLKCGCYNVILVDYMWGNSLDLIEAKYNLKIVAKQIVEVIRKLKKRFGLTPDQFVLTGHSYGAHVAGFVGQMEEIGKIVGVDPAGVVFTEKTPLDDRLDAKDADCVEVIHCNAGQCLPWFFGVNFTCGTIDFWVNGGLFQKSCYTDLMKSFVKQDFIYGTFNLYPAACFHFQCLQFYKASINPTDKQFVGIQCDSYEDFQAGKCEDCGDNGEKCAVMGAYTCDCMENSKSFKNYYLDTDNKCPYIDNSKLNTEGLFCEDTII